MQTKNTTSILVIDDDPVIKEVVEAYLLRDNYLMFFAESGEEGLVLADDVLPDLILLDIMMPGMDGFETFTKIRENSKLVNVPVLFMSCIDDRDTLRQSLDAGIDDFINKPFDKIEFRAKIRAITRVNRSAFYKTVNRLESIIYDKDVRIAELQKENELLKHQLSMIQEVK
jgi:DNA-binding response OmpR family regulator